MRFNEHSDLSGQHAFLSPSKPAWLKYDEDKLSRVFFAARAAAKGSELHALAHDLIRLNVRLEDIPKTLNMYVNDAIGYRMMPEQTLRYSKNCFGTADAISFRDNTLRISDLKTGITVVSEVQLMVYAALFCLEYDMKPNQITIELRIYQNNRCKIYAPDPDSIFHIMDKIVTYSGLVTTYWEESV